MELVELSSEISVVSGLGSTVHAIHGVSSMSSHTTVHMSASGQVDIPPALREQLHWNGAMDLDAELTPSGLLIQPKRSQKKTRRLEELRGLLKHNGDRISDKDLQRPVDLAGNT